MAPTRKSTRAARGPTTATTGPARATRGRAAEPVAPPRDTENPIMMNQAMLDQFVDDRVAAALAAATNSTTHAETSRPTHNNRGCTYPEFRKVMDGGFGGTEGAIGLTRWIEKLETVFRISSCKD